MLAPTGGVGRHTFHLLKALVELKEDVEYVAYVPPGSLRTGRLPSWGGSRLRWVEAGRFLVPWRSWRDALDVFHGPNFKLQTEGRYGGVVTVHDLWLDRHPEYSTKLFGQRASFRRTRRTAWRARKVITVSRHSARDLEELYGLPPDRIAVIPNGVSEEFRPARSPAALTALSRRLGLPDAKFILFVGGADPRKNHSALLEAYARRRGLLAAYVLVMVGDAVHRFGSIPETAGRLGIQEQVICTGGLSISDLQTLYAHAAVFVFPSRYEGFGMPVLEAMACGTPVITSTASALPEVAGDAAVLVDPDDADGLGAAVLRVLGDDAFRKELTDKGLARVKGYTWEQAARRTLAVYRELVTSLPVTPVTPVTRHLSPITP